MNILYVVINTDLGWDNIVAIYPADKFTRVQVEAAHKNCYVKEELMNMRLWDEEDYVDCENEY